MLRIPKTRAPLREWIKELIDELTASAQERGMIYSRATQYYYQGTADNRAAIYNKTGPFIRKLAGFLMQPTDVRFSLVFDSGEPESVLERSELVSEKLTADFRQTDSDTTFAEAVVWSMVNGCHFLKVLEDGGAGFKVVPVHPQNFGVISETTISLDEQEAFVHVSFPTHSWVRTHLEQFFPNREKEIMQRLDEEAQKTTDEEIPSYFHQIVVGGLQPLGNVGELPPVGAAGMVNVFPVPTPWRPNRKFNPTCRFCEVWIHDRDRKDWTTFQVIYPDIILNEDRERENISKIPGRHPFIKIQPVTTPGYFWGRSTIADVQLLQDLLSKRLRDIKVMWDRNVNAPQVFSGFTSITEEQYYKIINEGGYINDPNPNAKATKLVEPPPDNYLEELEFLFKLFDEASGFSPIMSGQGEPGVRAGVHAQTLVRTSSPSLIDQASRIEKSLADTGYLALRLMQSMDPRIYITDDNKIEFFLDQLPDEFQVQVDSHSASPAFAEDNRQVAIALARAGAIDAEDLIHMLHPPGSQLLLARLKQRQKEQAKQHQEDKQEEMMKAVLRIPEGRHGQGGGRQKQGGLG